MNDNEWIRYTSDAISVSNLSTTYATNYAITTDYQDYNSVRVNSEVLDLKNEIKELKKRLSNLSTLVLTHIGKEQLEKFNKENE